MNKYLLFFFLFCAHEVCMKGVEAIRDVIIYPKEECKKYTVKKGYKVLIIVTTAMILCFFCTAAYFNDNVVGVVKREFETEAGTIKKVEYVDKVDSSNRYNVMIETKNGDIKAIENVCADELEPGDVTVIYTSSNPYLYNVVVERNSEVSPYYEETYGSNWSERILLLICTLIGVAIQLRFMKKEIYKEENTGVANVLQISWKGGLIFYCLVMLVCVFNVSGIPHLDMGAAISFATYITSSLLYLLIVGKRQIARIKEGEENGVRV